MRKEAIFVDVWVVSYFNAVEGLHYNEIHNTCDEATADFDKIASDAMIFALEEIADFKVSRNLSSLTICDSEDDRVVVSCEVTKHTIVCGTMSM